MVTDTSPTARALRTLELIQSRPGVTAAVLGERLGVTERAARRYVATLRDAGIPVEAERGPLGGYRLGRGVRLPPLVFSEAEALGLVMAVLDGQRSARDDDPVGSALGKLLRALPETVSRQAAVVREFATPTPNRAAAQPDPEITTALVTAAADRMQVRLSYRSEAGREWEEQVDPWAVVVRHGRWYVLCHSHRVAEVRTYRLDRIHQVVALADRFTVPEDLDAVALLERHLGVGWEHETRVRFEASAAEVAHFIRPPMGLLEPTLEGGCLLTGSTSNPQMYAAEWLARIPLPFRVEAGPELRAAVVAVADRLAAAAR